MPALSETIALSEKEAPAPPPKGEPTGKPFELPTWYPAWARALAELYFSGTTCLFILHGNVHDLIHCRKDDRDEYCNLSEFLATQLFGSWDMVLSYDLARGLCTLAGSFSPWCNGSRSLWVSGVAGRENRKNSCWRWTA